MDNPMWRIVIKQILPHRIIDVMTIENNRKVCSFFVLLETRCEITLIDPCVVRSEKLLKKPIRFLPRAMWLRRNWVRDYNWVYEPNIKIFIETNLTQKKWFFSWSHFFRLSAQSMAENIKRTANDGADGWRLTWTFKAIKEEGKNSFKKSCLFLYE